MIHLLVADDHPLARAGVAGLTADSDIDVVCEVATCEEAVRQAVRSKADVVLLDVRHARRRRLSRAAADQAAEAGAAGAHVFGVRQRPGDQPAHRLGAAGYIPKGLGREPFLATIRKAVEGKRAWTRQQLRRMRAKLECDDRISEHTVDLTTRERAVLAEIVKGLVNEDIADELGIDVETVKQHVKHILRKLGVEDRTQAAVWAVRHGLE